MRLSQGQTLQQVADEFGVHLTIQLVAHRAVALRRAATPTVHDDVIAFFDRLSKQSHPVPCIAVMDHAPILKGELMESKRREWADRGLCVYYLPPYSPELNQIEILWKQAKYFWRRLVSLKGLDLLNEVNSIMQRFGKEFTINFA